MARPNGMAIFLLLFLFGSAALGGACAEDHIPKASGPINDFADVITPPYEKRMSNIAKELLTKTGVALFVVTMPDLGGADAKEYAERLYTAWDIGKKRGDKGVLIIASVRDRKLQVRMGAGLKTILSQRQIAEIQDRFVAPYLKQNNYDDGLLNGVSAIAKLIAKEAGVTLKEL